MKDYYKILGLSKSASKDEIKRAYRKLAKEFHPDVNKSPEAAARFKDINEAYEILGDEAKRKEYDNPSFKGFGGNFSGFGDFDGMNFSDLFSQFSGGSRSGFSSKTNFRQPNFELEITMSEALIGCKKTVQTNAGKKEFVIKAGVLPRQELSSSDGTLRAIIKIKPDKNITRDGNDITKDIDVPLKIALFGGKADFVTLSGESKKITVQPNSANGTLLKAKGFGIDNAYTLKKGDLYLRVRVILPDISTLSPEFIELAKREL